MRSEPNGVVEHELPAGWKRTSLGEVCSDPQYGWTTAAAQEGTLRMLRTSDITSGTIDWSTVPFCTDAPAELGKYLLRDGDIVISRAGSVGCSLLVRHPQQAVFASYLIRFRPHISETYLSYFLSTSSYWRSISEKSLGIAVPNVNATKLKQVRLPLAPSGEQRRIVAKIEELFSKLDAGVEALKRAKAQLKRYRQSVLKAAFEGRLTEDWRKEHEGEIEPASLLLARIKAERKKRLGARYKEPTPVGSSDLPDLPEGWVWARLPTLGTLARGKSKHRPRNDPTLFGGPYPFVQTGDIRNCAGVITNFSQSYNERGLKQSNLWPAGTLCITIAANIAETAILGIPACFPDSVVGFLPDAGLTQATYVQYFLNTIKSRLEIDASATAQKNINLDTLNGVAVALAPYLEQKQVLDEIGRRLSATSAAEKAIDQELKRAERLRQSILKLAFEGKLAPQDPNDEPAERLLERIKAERASSQNGRKSRCR